MRARLDIFARICRLGAGALGYQFVQVAVLLVCIACNQGDVGTSNEELVGESRTNDSECQKIEMYRIDRDEQGDGVTDVTVGYNRVQIFKDSDDRIVEIITTDYDLEFQVSNQRYFSVRYDDSGRVASSAETTPEPYRYSDSTHDWRTTYFYQENSLTMDNSDGCDGRLIFAAPRDISAIELGVYDEETEFVASVTYPASTQFSGGQVSSLTIDYSEESSNSGESCYMPMHVIFRLEFEYQYEDKIADWSLSRVLPNNEVEKDSETSYKTDPLSFDQLFVYRFPSLGQTRVSSYNNSFLVMAPTAEYCIPN